ncbi:Uncharacterized protein MLTONO_0523 [Mesorhizobium loti]|nr:Uncharacterized protein MLTONO_0523 [Mesorhizobium loti]
MPLPLAPGLSKVITVQQEPPSAAISQLAVNRIHAADRHTDLEPAINDVARLGYVTELLVASLLEDLASYAKSGFSAADALALVERKREVVVAHVEDVEIKTRQLREAYNGRVGG